MNRIGRVYEQIDMVGAYQRLLEAQRTATSAEDREAADDDLSHFLRMLAAGRIQEWFANRQAGA